MRRRLCLVALSAMMACVVATTSFAKPTKKSAPKPISAIMQEMSVVAGDLSKTQTGEPVQIEQKIIVRDLDDLIAALEKECAACRGGIKKNNPRSGMRDSMISGGTGGIGDLVNPGESNKDWAKLSSRERDRILQSMSEGFPPEYRTVLERYYRRLAEEKAAPASGTAGAKPGQEAAGGSR